MDDGKIENITCEGPCSPMGKELFTLSAVEMRNMERILFMGKMLFSQVTLMPLLFSRRGTIEHVLHCHDSL
jgi:hypothetical protein